MYHVWEYEHTSATDFAYNSSPEDSDKLDRMLGKENTHIVWDILG